MRSGKKESLVREAVGIFNEAEHLKKALAELQEAGFGRHELGLLASEYAVKESLHDLYTCTDTTWQPGEEPACAFVSREGTGDTGTTHGGGLFFIGTAGGAGAVVASSAVLGGALLAAVSGVLAVGAVGALVAYIIHQKDADFLQQQVEEGRLLLFARVKDEASEARAREILSRYAETGVKIIEVPEDRRQAKRA